MMESPRLEEEKIIKDVKTSFQIRTNKKEAIDITIKDIRNLFKLEKENKATKDRTIRDIRKVCRLEEDDNQRYQKRRRRR